MAAYIAAYVAAYSAAYVADRRFIEEKEAK
jgi:hypothetical protein